MRPKKAETTGEEDLFRARLDQIIHMKHELVQLAGKLDWDWLDGEIAPLYSDKGRPGIETRFVIGLLLLKHIFALSDEGVCERWVYDPYFQYFTGEEFFQHAFPHERSDLSHWRKRLGEKLELLLAESLRVAHEAGALRTKDLKRVHGRHHRAAQGHHVSDRRQVAACRDPGARLARRHGIRLRQSYLRIAKRAASPAEAGLEQEGIEPGKLTSRPRRFWGGQSGGSPFDRLWLRNLHSQYPGDPQKRKIESQKNDQAHLRAPLVLDGTSKNVC